MADNEKNRSTSGFIGYIIRFVLISIILAITSFLTPGFSIVGIWPLILAAIVITILDYLAEKLMKVDAAPFGKGIKGFLIAAVILYLTQFLVPNMRVSIIGSLLAALVIGIIDAIMPGRVM